MCARGRQVGNCWYKAASPFSSASPVSRLPRSGRWNVVLLPQSCCLQFRSKHFGLKSEFNFVFVLFVFFLFITLWAIHMMKFYIVFLCVCNIFSVCVCVNSFIKWSPLLPSSQHLYPQSQMYQISHLWENWTLHKCFGFLIG